VQDDATMQAAANSDFYAQLELAMPEANIPVLLMLLVQLTGDLRWLEDPYCPSRQVGVSDNDDGGLPETVQADIRAQAAAAIRSWHAGKPVAIEQPDESLLLRMLGTAMGEEIPDQYGPMLHADLANVSEVAHRDIAAPPGFTAIIVGAGVSGLCAAVAFERARVPYTIFEARDRVGGVWDENAYPGAGVDTPSHLYSFSFAPYEWSQYFALREELQSYLEKVADDFDIRRHIRFNTRVVDAEWRDEDLRWHLQVEHADSDRLLEAQANVLVSAVGIFNPPQYPSLDGLERFSGPVFHTARWPRDLDLTDKRVAVVGNGASAMQIVPSVATAAASIAVFQRSPHWIMPFEKFQVKVSEPVRWLFRELPLYRAWYRLRLAWTFNDKVHPTLQKDPDWPHADRSLNAKNERYREFLVRYMMEQLDDHQDLAVKLLPTYPPYGKRMLLDNGWYRTLRRENVQLVTDPITEIRKHSVRTSRDSEYEADVLVIATGFDVTHFFSSFPIRGRSGKELQEAGDDVRAYLGTVMPDFPNFFSMYGPNTQPGHGGSIMFTIETQTHYMISLLEQMFADDLGAAECRAEVADAFNAAIDELNANMVWTHPGMRTYYRNSKGRVVVNSPYRNVDWWYMTRKADLNEYHVDLAPAASPARSAYGDTRER
jgi:4-hydroxyacetophenone monooxygenase